MSNNLLTKHFKSEKKRVSVLPNDKKASLIETKSNKIKSDSNHETEDSSISKPKTRRSRQDKDNIDLEYEKLMNTSFKKPKLIEKNEDKLVPKTKIKGKKPVKPELENANFDENQFTPKNLSGEIKKLDRLQNKTREKKDIISGKLDFSCENSAQKDSQMSENTEIYKIESKQKDKKKDADEIVSDKTKLLIEKALAKKNIPNTENLNLKNNNKNQNIDLKKIPELISNIVIPAKNEKIILNDEIIHERKELTGKTLDTLNRLKNERKNKFDRLPVKEKIRSESIFSLKFRYEELIQEQRQLPLPPSYKNLINLFADLDTTLNFFKIKRKIPKFDEILKSIEMTKKR